MKSVPDVYEQSQDFPAGSFEHNTILGEQEYSVRNPVTLHVGLLERGPVFMDKTDHR